MNKLKRLTVSFTLTLVLAATAFAGETQGPPCAPGHTETPPCASQPLNDDLTEPGQISSPPDSDTVEMTYLAEAVLWALSLF